MAKEREALVKAALGAQWQRLPGTLKRSFNLRPGSDATVELRGTMYEIWHSPAAALFIYLARLMGALVPYQGRGIPIRIEMRTYASDTKFMHWRRIHQFPGHPDVEFATRMEYIGGGRIVEYVHLGLGMCMDVSVEGSKLTFRSPCYEWKLFGRRLSIPGWLLLGNGQITERALSADVFEMFFEINHPLFGQTYRYNGIFTLEAATQAGGE